MLYEKDFLYLNKDFLPGQGCSHSTNKRLVAVRDESDVQENPARGIRSFLKMYLLQSSLHGVRYMVEDELKLFERLIWTCIVTLSIFGTTYLNILLANRFNSSPLRTVVESTAYPISDISFPAVTVCSHSRVDKTKIEEAKEKFIPNATEEIEVLFDSLVSALDDATSSIFFDVLRSEDELLPLSDSINISEMIQFLTHSCESLFTDECWWRYKTFRCCDIFVPQKSEFGRFCYAFNSLTNNLGLTKWDENEPDWPVSTSKYGARTGLAINLGLSAVKVIIHHPFGWPSKAFSVLGGRSAEIILNPILSYAMPSTRRYDPVSRDCVFEDEAADPKYLKLPGLPYMKANCLSACRQTRMLERCNCVAEPFFPIGNYQPCTTLDIQCLSNNTEEDPFTLQKQCSCTPECEMLDYNPEIFPMYFLKKYNSKDVTIVDIHFQHGTLIKYRTDVVYGWLDLLVAFGGIGGLLMGASILSAVELIYYFTIRFWVYMRNHFGKVKTSKAKEVSPPSSGILVGKY